MRHTRSRLSLARQITALVVGALLPALVSAAFHPRRPPWTARVADAGLGVSLEEVAGWKDPVIWLDARSGDAFDRGHIPGALSLNEAEWEMQFAAVVAVWRPGVRLVVYCDSRECNSSESVARRLRRELGMNDVVVLKGGWLEWQEAQKR